MNIVRGVVDWINCENDGINILNKLEKDINFSHSIEFNGVFSNKSKYKIAILNSSSNRVNYL